MRMHISDVAGECARECLRLARSQAGQPIAMELMTVAKRLSEAARRDTELQFADDEVFDADAGAPPPRSRQIAGRS